MTAAAPLAPGRTFQVEVAPDNMHEIPAKAIYLGGPKTGKTTHMTTWNESTSVTGEPGLFAIIFDYNIGTLASVRPKIPHVVVESTERFRKEVIPWVLNGGLAKEFPSVQTVGVDSLSFYAKLLEQEVNGDWQVFSSRISNDLGQLTRLANPRAGLPKHYNLVCTCHEKDRYSTAKTASGQRERTLVGTEPAIAGQMSALITGYFDVVLYTERKVVAVEVKGAGGAKQYENQVVYSCRAMEPRDHKAPAGGTLWGKPITGQVEGTYAGLRRYCGFEDAGATNTGVAQENSS